MRCVLAIDPGRSKCGVAVVSSTAEVCFRAVVAAAEVTERVQELCLKFCPEAVVVGDGTGSKPLLLQIMAAGLGAPIRSVDESFTSEAARLRYLQSNPPKGWQRMLPRSLRTPCEPIDDYVAIILAERFWNAE